MSTAALRGFLFCAPVQDAHHDARNNGAGREEPPPSSRVAIVAGNAGEGAPWLFSVGSRGFLSLTDAETHATSLIASQRGQS